MTSTSGHLQDDHSRNDSVPLQRGKHLSKSGESVANSTDDSENAPLEHQDDVNEGNRQRTQRPRRSLPKIGSKYVVDHTRILSDDDEEFTLEDIESPTDSDESNFSDD